MVEEEKKKIRGHFGSNDLMQCLPSPALMFIRSKPLMQICIYKTVNASSTYESWSCEIMSKDVSVMETARGMWGSLNVKVSRWVCDGEAPCVLLRGCIDGRRCGRVSQFNSTHEDSYVGKKCIA